MAQTNSRFFSVMVVGDNPDSILEKYSVDKEVEPYVKYKFSQAEKYRSKAIKVLEELLKKSSETLINPQIISALEERLKSLKMLSSFDYYRQLTDGLYYDENGDALSSENPDGKWKTAHIGRNFSLPLILKNGKEVYTAKAYEVDWEKMHLCNQEVYRAAWEMVMEGREPKTNEEEVIYTSMKDKQTYFSNFPDKEAYVKYSTAYWNYAYVDEKGWVDVSNENENEWINNFYDRFIENLDSNATVSIYECSINSD